MLRPEHEQPSSSWRSVARIAILVAWATLVAVFVLRFRAEVAAAFYLVYQVHPAIIGVLALFLAWTAAASAGWRALHRASVPAGHPVPSLGQLVSIRIQAQAVNTIVPTAGLGGEALRAVSAAGRREALGGSFVAVMLDNMAMMTAGLCVVFASVPLAAIAFRADWSTSLAAGATVMGLGMAVCVAPFALAPIALRWIRRDGQLGMALRSLVERPAVRRAFGTAVLWHLGERTLGVAEVHLGFLCLGVSARLSDSILVSAVFIAMSFLVFFVPSQLGAAEFAVMVTCTALGLPPALGLSVALLRRSRQLCVCLAGLFLLAWTRRRGPVLQGPDYLNANPNKVMDGHDPSPV